MLWTFYSLWQKVSGVNIGSYSKLAFVFSRDLLKNNT